MASLHRFYVPLPFDEPHLVIAGSEAHHLLHVLRLNVGQRVALFDGRGREAQARVDDCSRNEVRCELLDVKTDPAAMNTGILLASPLPKGDRLRWLVEKTTELGVQRLTPLQTDRSIVHPHAAKLDRLLQTVIAACKQSGRNTLMTIDPLTDWETFVRNEIADRLSDAQPPPAVIAHPSGEPAARVLSQTARFNPAGTRTEPGGSPLPLVLAVGPEGGLADRELASAVAAGARLASLGPRILRIETAAIALAALASGLAQ